MIVRFQFRFGTTAEWAAANPVLAEGEPGWDTDVKAQKIGDGTSPWDDLPFQTVDASAISTLVANAQAAALAAEAAAEDAADAAASATGATDSGVAALINDTTPPNLTRAALDAIYSHIGHPHTASDISNLASAIETLLAGFLVAGANVAINHTGGTFVISSSGGGGTGLDSEAMMDFLGRVTNATKGLFGTGLIGVAYDDVNDKITISTTATANSTDSFLLNRANQTGQGDESLRVWANDWMVLGNPSSGQATAAGVYRVPSWDGDSWEHASLDTSRFPTKDTTGGGLNGSIRQFADVPDAALAEGETYVGPVSGTTLDVVQIGNLLDSFDPTTLRLLAARLPLYRPAIHILDPGEVVPSNTDLPYLVFRKTAAPSLVPVLLDADGVFAQSANNMVANSGPAVTPAGTVLCLVVGASGEATTPAEWTMAWAAGACTFTNRSRGLSAGNAQVTIYEGVVGTSIPANTNLTLTSKLPDGTTNQNRVHQMASLFALPNVDSTTPFDQQQNGGGGSSSALDKTLTFGSPTPQPDEIIIMALVNNYGTGGVTRPTQATPPAQDLQSVLSSAASARNLWVGYRILNSIEANAAITVHIDGSDGATGGWAAAAAGFLAA